MTKPHVCPLCRGSGYASLPEWRPTGGGSRIKDYTLPCPACKGKRILWEPEPVTAEDVRERDERPDLGKPEVDANGYLQTWPWFCGECGQTTWYKLNEVASEVRACCGAGPMTAEDLGTAWWKALHKSGVEQGKRLGAKDGLDSYQGVASGD
jgi:hypothetical protein